MIAILNILRICNGSCNKLECLSKPVNIEGTSVKAYLFYSPGANVIKLQITVKKSFITLASGIIFTTLHFTNQPDTVT